MEAKELMVGNWIQSPPLSIPRLQIESNGWMKITGYGISVLESDTSNKLGWSGIPLTAEILLKCGFENKVKDIYEIQIDNGWTLNLEYDYIFLNYGDNECEISHVKFKYLHQLQNLYFALTGEELDLKL